MYQYYKIDAIALKAIPKPVSGTYPPSAWAYLEGNESDVYDILYSSIPRMPGSKIIKGNKTQTLYFKRIGRQDDFGWYHDTGLYPTFKLRIRFAEPPSANYKYTFQLKYFLTFSMLIEKSSAKIEEPYDEIKAPVIVPKPHIKSEVITKLIQRTIPEEKEVSLQEVSVDESFLSTSTRKTRKFEKPKQLTKEELDRLAQEDLESDMKMFKRNAPLNVEDKKEEKELDFVSVDQPQQAKTTKTNKDKRLQKKITAADNKVKSWLDEMKDISPAKQIIALTKTKEELTKKPEENKYIIQSIEKAIQELQDAVIVELKSSES
jgi:hypothetical protein